MKLNSDKKELQQGSQFNQISSKCTWQGLKDDYQTYCGIVSFSKGSKDNA
jgi:hypothetical protein